MVLAAGIEKRHGLRITTLFMTYNHTRCGDSETKEISNYEFPISNFQFPISNL